MKTTRTIFVAVLCAFSIGACHRHARTREPSAHRFQLAPSTDNAAAYEAAPASSGCEGSCTHYLECRGIGDERSFDACVKQCTRMHYSETNLLSYQQTDCATAISIVEGTSQQQRSAPATQSSECNGCVWDGSSCVWISQGNWGTGPNNPYSGAVSSCNAYCCGH